VAGSVSSIEGPALHAPRLVAAAAIDRPADRGEDGGAERGADDRQRQLVQAIGIVQIGHRAFAEPGGEEAVEELADLVDARREGGREHEDHQFPDAGGEPRALEESEMHARAAHALPAERELKDAAHQHRHRHGLDRARAALRRQQQRDDQREVQQRRREGGDGEARQRVEHARQERNEADEDEIGEGDAGEHHRELELAGHLVIFRRHQPDEARHDDLEDERDQHQARHEHRQHFVREALGILDPAFGIEALAEEGHEPRGEGAFAEQPAKDVRDQEGDQEGVIGMARAEHARADHVAREAEHAADHGQPADGADRLR
jgi:hypothetical protein